MTNLRQWTLALGAAAFADASMSVAENSEPVPDEVIAAQRASLAAATEGTGFGPQSPRDIGQAEGTNPRVFSKAPAVTGMTLCDIHFHENAEHRGGEFTTYAGNGDGNGYGTGYKFSGELTPAEKASAGKAVGASEHGDLVPGDTIEAHFVYSTAQATLGNGLGTCLGEATSNPQLRVEAVVAVLVSEGGADFTELARIQETGGLNQLPNLPTDLGAPVTYTGSTTGPAYNEKGSPFQVTWNVRPKVLKLDIHSVDAWLGDNPFSETHAHGVRNLVRNPALLSPIN
ncbi:delta-class carbonic anhydrase [Leisingera sp. S232]|uniref:delta-class carbonic anhydrase n=1 Tax=Leisingera sp. S232 TaxID=3415132 RepID=UPI003C7D3F54